MSRVLLTRDYVVHLERESRWVRKNWTGEFGALTDENVERVARNRLAAAKIWEYPTCGLKDGLRQTVALWLAPWLGRP